jgi:hypothetical protein
MGMIESRSIIPHSPTPDSGSISMKAAKLKIGVRSQESGARRKEEEERRKEPEEVFLQI